MKTKDLKLCYGLKSDLNYLLSIKGPPLWKNYSNNTKRSLEFLKKILKKQQILVPNQYIILIFVKHKR